MFFRKKKTREEEIRADNEMIEKNTVQLDLLIQLCETEKTLADKLRELQIKVKYFSPSAEKSIAHLDKKIGDKLGDLKIALGKAKASGIYYYSNELVETIENMVAERKSMMA